MNNNWISQKQEITMVAINVIGTSIIIVMGMKAKINIRISILLTGGASVLLMLIYARLMSVFARKQERIRK